MMNKIFAIILFFILSLCVFFKMAPLYKKTNTITQNYDIVLPKKHGIDYQALVDPFFKKTLKQNKIHRTQAIIPCFVLKGIIGDKHTPKAILVLRNDQSQSFIVQVGDYVQQCHILAIKEKSVVIKQGQNQFEIFLSYWKKIN